MRIFIASLIISFHVFNGFTQPQFLGGINFSVNNSWLYSMDDFNKKKGISYYFPTFRWSAGIKGVYEKDKYGFLTGLSFSRKGQIYKINDDKFHNRCVGGPFFKIALNYLQLPVFLQYKFSNINKYNLWALMGGTFSYLLFPKDNYNSMINCNVLINSDDIYNKLDYGIISGFKASRRIKDNLHFALSIKIDLGFNYVIDNAPFLKERLDKTVNLANRVDFGLFYRF